MRAMSDPIIVAIIAGGFSITVALINQMRRQNNKDHALNSKKLDYVADLLRDHIRGHK